MAFELVSDPMEPQVEYLPISSVTLSVGELMELDAGSTTWTIGDASTINWQRKAVAIEAATTSATEVKAMLVHPFQLWKVGTTANSADSGDGDNFIVASGGLTVTNTASTAQEACFQQVQKVGAAALKKIIGRFNGSTGLDPDVS